MPVVNCKLCGAQILRPVTNFFPVCSTCAGKPIKKGEEVWEGASWWARNGVWVKRWAIALFVFAVVVALLGISFTAIEALSGVKS